MIIDKNTKINIITAENLTPTEKFAVCEMSSYLEWILSIRPSLSNSKKENAINFFIGNTLHNESLFCNLEENSISVKLDSEGIYIAIFDQSVYILGNYDNDGYNRGVLYSVYEFLERYMGCCFGAYASKQSNAGEIVPIVTEINLPNGVYVKEKADLPYRTAILQYDCWVGNADHRLNIPFINWLAKNRYNRILTWVSVYEQYRELGLIPELEKRGIRLTVGHHEATSTWLPQYGNKYFPKKYREEYPEFYRLKKDGTRYSSNGPKDFLGQLILCQRNQEAIKETAKNIITWLKDNPIVDTIAFWPNDYFDDQCCCEECSKYSKNENYLYFENELAKEISAVLPNVMIDVLIYQDLWDCPQNLELCDNIIIDESTWAFDGIRACGKKDGTSLINTPFYHNILDYRKICKNVVFYEYYMANYSNKQRLLPAADEMQSIYKDFIKVGISGSGTQIECYNVWNNLLNFYCFARTAYDTSLSVSEQIDRIGELFGEGKPYISKIFEIYEETLDGQLSILDSCNYFIENINKEEIYTLFAKALNAAKDATQRNNIKLLRMAFRYTDIGTKVNDNPDTFPELEAELVFMCKIFNSYLGDGNYGISIPINVTPKEPGCCVTIKRDYQESFSTDEGYRF